ncbi:MAG: SpoIID/LytB domain-containing protein [bacterium]
MRKIIWILFLITSLDGCATFSSREDPFAMPNPVTDPVVSGPEVPRPVIRVAIVSRAPSVRLSVPQSFALTGFDLDAAQGSRDDSDQTRQITLTTNQIDGKRALLTSAGGKQVKVDGKTYRGSMAILDNGDGTLTVVNDVDLEDYVMGVVSGEVPGDWPLEALKAQALAARTFAVLKHRQALADGKPYDLENTALSQMYKGSGAVNENIREAVHDTDGEIITYDGKPIEAFFHSNCGGETCGAKSVWGQNLPYLKPVICGFCKDGPHFHWTAEMGMDSLVEDLKNAGLDVEAVTGFQVLSRDDSGRIAMLGIRDSEGSLKIMKANAFRMALGPDLIRSTRFEVQIKNDQAYFKGLGWGHGVGMCQEGACGMARKGYNAYEIIRHYYRDVLVEKMRSP